MIYYKEKYEYIEGEGYIIICDEKPLKIKLLEDSNNLKLKI